VPAAREALRMSLGRFGTPQMVMRIGYGQPGRATPRRPVEEVLDLPVVAAGPPPPPGGGRPPRPGGGGRGPRRGRAGVPA